MAKKKPSHTLNEACLDGAEIAYQGMPQETMQKTHPDNCTCTAKGSCCTRCELAPKACKDSRKKDLVDQCAHRILVVHENFRQLLDDVSIHVPRRVRLHEDRVRLARGLDVGDDHVVCHRQASLDAEPIVAHCNRLLDGTDVHLVHALLLRPGVQSCPSDALLLSVSGALRDLLLRVAPGALEHGITVVPRRVIRRVRPRPKELRHRSLERHGPIVFLRQLESDDRGVKRPRLMCRAHRLRDAGDVHRAAIAQRVEAPRGERFEQRLRDRRRRANLPNQIRALRKGLAARAVPSPDGGSEAVVLGKHVSV
mmetsp:Transcript_57977/g.176616  ORF Transcript_57977/g.176616 Transcript_57977/m.176616 type:complete len:310 (-) Transcript_57977:1185-2114(-)